LANFEFNLASQQNKAEALPFNSVYVTEEKDTSIVTLESSSNAKNADQDIKIVINHKSCKGCGICYSFCPKDVYDKDQFDKVVIINAEACVGCGVCESLCPDYCIKIGA
jgi:2-oxoglutarate ferredoxin oxidoreductase subunit delta